MEVCALTWQITHIHYAGSGKPCIFCPIKTLNSFVPLLLWLFHCVKIGLQVTLLSDHCDHLLIIAEITCPAPRSLANGTLRLSSRPIYCGSYVDYTCSIGYNLKGSIKRTCLSDGSWSGDNPVCESKRLIIY